MPAPHPAEFRQRAVALARTGDTPIAQLTRDLQIGDLDRAVEFYRDVDLLPGL